MILPDPVELGVRGGLIWNGWDLCCEKERVGIGRRVTRDIEMWAEIQFGWRFAIGFEQNSG